MSIELTLEQISRLGGKIPLGIVSYGLLPLMLTRNNPARNDGKPFRSSKEISYLRDRKGIAFPLQSYGACTEILNSVPVVLSDRKNEIKGVDFEVFRFTVEDSFEMKNTLEKGKFTRGLYYRGVE